MHKHTIDLLERLLAATEDDRIKWEEVPGKTAFSYLAGEFVVLVDAASEAGAFRLHDAKGRSLEQAGMEDLAAVNLGSGVTALSAMQRICDIAKRQTMGTDEAIASVLEHLQNLDGEGEEAKKAENPAPFELADEGETFMEELAPKVEEDHGSARRETSENIEIEEEITADEPHEGAMEAPVHPDHETPLKAPQKKKNRKRSLFNFFGQKKA